MVYIEESQNLNLQQLAAAGQGVVMFDFQRHITYRDTLILPLSLSVSGRQYRIANGDDLVAFAGEHFTKQFWLERKYMSFRVVDDPQPLTCRH